MADLKFSNADIKKIVDTVSKGKKWEVSETSHDNKFTITLRNDPKKSKIDVLADNKFVDDYTYDTTEADDVYATVLNVLDYLTNLMNRYNKKHVVKEETDMEFFQRRMVESLKFEGASEEIKEAISQGMLRAYARRMKEEDIHYTCKECNTNIPKYGGRYPGTCPSCGASLTAMKEADKDEAIWGGPFKRGEVVSVGLPNIKGPVPVKLIIYDPVANTYAGECSDGSPVGEIKPSQIYLDRKPSQF